jgi:hypothetical protein
MTASRLAAGDCPTGQRREQCHVAREQVFARRPHLAHHEDPLAAVRLDRNRDLRILQVAIRQMLFDFLLELTQRRAARLDATDQRKGERAVLLHRVLAGQLRLAEHGDVQNILGANPVIRLGRCGLHEREQRHLAHKSDRKREEAACLHCGNP